MRVLAFGTYESQRHERVKVLVQGLAAHGHHVVECNVPLDIGNETRVRMLRRPVLVPLLVARVLSCWARLVPRARREDEPDVVLVGYLGQFDVLLARLLWPRTTIVLDHSVPAVGVARDHGMTQRWRLLLLSSVDYLAASAANIVLVDTHEHLPLLPSHRRRSAMVVHSGAPDAYFRERPCAPEWPLRVLFCGTYTPLHGAAVIAQAIALLDRRVEVRFTMIGHGPDAAVARDIVGRDDRVRWVEWVPPETLARELAQHHVCLGIFGVTDKAARVVPNKLFQGVASGCAIVTGDTAPQARVFGSAAILVPRGDPAALAAVLTELAERPERVASARRRSARLATSFTPFETVEPLHRQLAALQGRAARQMVTSRPSRGRGR